MTFLSHFLAYKLSWNPCILRDKVQMFEGSTEALVPVALIGISSLI